MNWYSLIYEQKDLKEVNIDLPASKSISNRLLVLQYLSGKQFEIENLSKANDTILVKDLLRNHTLPEEINCQDAGTAFRFLTCLCATMERQTFTITGTARLLERPMQALFDCLRQLGADIKVEKGKAGGIIIKGGHLSSSPLSIQGDVSSQFISGLCLIATRIENGLDLTITAPVLSRPYIEMTLALMKQMGIDSVFTDHHIRIHPQKITAPSIICVESDWSSACFFYSLMILSEQFTSIQLAGLGKEDIQGDRFIAELGKQFGIVTSYQDAGARLSRTSPAITSAEINLEAYPDLAIPLLVACAFKHPKMVFSGLGHLRLKESNRIYALQKNLEKIGILLLEENGRISFKKVSETPKENPVRIHTYNDHRIAMSFSLVATLGYIIELDNMSCIRKSFPDFFAQMNKLGIRLRK